MIIQIFLISDKHMAGNSFGQSFKITTFGESHGVAVGVTIDGCPPGLELSEEDIQLELDRRRPGQSKITTPRKEADKVEILSGVFEGKTTGTPIAMIARNKNVKSEDYEHMKDVYRPSHADYVYEQKYGMRDWRGGGRSSARETWARVAAGAIAKKYLKKRGVEFVGYVEQVGEMKIDMDYREVEMKDVEANIMRCPDASMAEKMIEYVEKLREEGDSIGGVIGAVVRGVPVGLGEPVFDKLPADLGKAMMSINAVKGFEIGSGFEGVKLKGSDHNDEMEMVDGKVKMKTNNAGGVLGGISSGEDIYFRVAFKSVSTINKKQDTVSKDGKDVELKASGRHDSCVLPRAVAIVEAMAALVIMDHVMRNRGQCG